MREAEPSTPLKVVIVGAGVAGLETAMALRALAGPRVDITLVAPQSEFVYRPLSVAEPFGIDSPHTYPLNRIADDVGATFLQDELAWVGVRGQRAFLGSGEELAYDALVVALGARTAPAWPDVPTFGGPADVPMVRDLLAELECGEVRSLAFVVPSGVTWPFPLYELALLTAHRAREATVDVDITLFTPEREPLAVFGRGASGEVGWLLAKAGIRFEGGAPVEVTGGGRVQRRGTDSAPEFDRVLALPRLEGPAPRGLPYDDEGFVPIDAHGMVLGVEHVYAAGDGTDFPVKQGGIATQQADAVAEVIAKRAGARVDPRPLRPILRGHLLANGSSRFLRGELHHRDGGTSEASENTMWWPAGKVAGTYLAPYLAAHDGSSVGSRPERTAPVTSWVEESPYRE
jgi:sulfide:quinone oxidoreductase